MNILLTGGSGFLGSHLADRLLEEGNRVVIIDRAHGLSIMDEGVGKYFKGIDTVFHLAALTRPQWSIEHPEESNRINVGGTVKVFMHAKEHGVKRTVFVSSSSLYGENVCPTPESAIPNPMSPYALQKLVGEQYADLFGRIYGMEINSVRPFNVYGTRQSPKGAYAAAVPNFISHLNEGKTPWITGDGEQARDFIYVDDVVEIMCRAAKCKEYGEVFNAGSGINTSINDLYATISGIMGKDVAPDYIPAVLEPEKTLADMSKVKEMLDWEPQIDLVEGLRRTVEGTLK